MVAKNFFLSWQRNWVVPKSLRVKSSNKEKTLDPQVFSWIGKTIKKLQWIPNTIINTNVLEYFDNVYISDGFITGLSTHELGSI